jgi:hypothetical protein
VRHIWNFPTAALLHPSTLHRTPPPCAAQNDVRPRATCVVRWGGSGGFVVGVEGVGRVRGRKGRGGSVDRSLLGMCNNTQMLHHTQRARPGQSTNHNLAPAPQSQSPKQEAHARTFWHPSTWHLRPPPCRTQKLVELCAERVQSWYWQRRPPPCAVHMNEPPTAL